MAHRYYRELDELDPTIKPRISQKMQGEPKSEEHKAAISRE